ncbi:MAG: dihydrofolate reductase [Kosmotoga sp.]|nr:MAG: dihydrofolate reductase [Kosmotoga sp.]
MLFIREEVNILIVSMVVVSSINGIIAKNEKDSIDWGSKQDKTFFKNITQDSGAVIFGRKTFDNIGKPLPGRLNIVMTRNPESYESIKGKLFFTNMRPDKLLSYLQRNSYEHIIIGGGRSIYSQFLNKQLVNELYITFEPILLSEGIRMTDKLNKDIKLKKINTLFHTSNSIIIHYKILYSDRSA